MNRAALRLLVVVFWLGMTAWLVRYEAFPGFFSHTVRGYRDILSEDTIVQDSWMKLFFNGSPVGYSHTKVEMNEESALSRYQMASEIYLSLKLMDTRESVVVNADATLDALYHLQTFSVHAALRDMDLTVKARRIHAKSFSVRIQTGNAIQVTTIEIPDDVVIYSPMTDMAVSKLRPGQQMTIRALDPLSMSAADIIVRSIGRETIVLQDRSVQTRIIATDYMGMTTRSWLDHEGKVLRQETPLGLVAEAASPDEAMAMTSGSVEMDDVFQSQLVSMLGRLRPEKARHAEQKRGGTE